MPTGYTAELCEKDVPFEKFVLQCARAFGALILMRDDSFDAPIPEEFKPSDYNLKALEKAKTELDRITSMSDEEVALAAKWEYKEAVEQNKRSVSKAKEVRERLLGMRSKVADWKPPTEDHEELKKFMIQQIDSTVEWDGRSYGVTAVKMTGAAWRLKSIEALERSIVYHAKGHSEEIDRTNKRNAWVKALRESLTK